MKTSNLVLLPTPQPENSMPDMLRAIADEIEQGVIEATSGSLVLLGGVEEPVKVFLFGTTITVGDAVTNFELGKLRLLQIPLSLMLGG